LKFVKLVVIEFNIEVSAVTILAFISDFIVDKFEFISDLTDDNCVFNVFLYDKLSLKIDDLADDTSFFTVVSNPSINESITNKSAKMVDSAESVLLFIDVTAFETSDNIVVFALPTSDNIEFIAVVISVLISFCNPEVVSNNR